MFTISVQRVLITKATRPIVLALWSLALPMACLAAYLPISGPPQLRFQATRITVALITPPPLAVPAATQAAVEEPLLSTNHSPCLSEPIVLKAKSPTLCDNNGLAENPNVSMGGTDVLVTPQMMVPYFQGAPTVQKTPTPKLSPPVWFKPPVPLTHPRSKSTYSSP